MCKHTTHPMFLALISSIFSDLATHCNNASACIVYFFNTFTVEVQCVGGLCSKGCTILEKKWENHDFFGFGLRSRFSHAFLSKQTFITLIANSRKCNINKKKKTTKNRLQSLWTWWQHAFSTYKVEEHIENSLFYAANWFFASLLR